MAECKSAMEEYLDCLKDNADQHYKCRDFSRQYLQCRMDHELMAKENLDQLGFSKQAQVKGTPREYDNAKERAGFVAGKHILETDKQNDTGNNRERDSTNGGGPKKSSWFPW